MICSAFAASKKVVIFPSLCTTDASQWMCAAMASLFYEIFFTLLVLILMVPILKCYYWNLYSEMDRTSQFNVLTRTCFPWSAPGWVLPWDWLWRSYRLVLPPPYRQTHPVWRKNGCSESQMQEIWVKLMFPDTSTMWASIFNYGKLKKHFPLR